MNYKTITDIIGKGILAGTMAFGGMLPSYGEEAKQEKSLAELVKSLEETNKKSWKVLQESSKNMAESTKQLIDLIREPQRKEEAYSKRDSQYCKLTDDQRYSFGLEAGLKDNKIRQEYGVHVKNGKVMVTVNDEILQNGDFVKIPRIAPVSTWQEVLNYKKNVKDDNGKPVKTEYGAKTDFIGFVDDVLNAGRKAYLGERPKTGFMLGMGSIGYNTSQGTKLMKNIMRGN